MEPKTQVKISTVEMQLDRKVQKKRGGVTDQKVKGSLNTIGTPSAPHRESRVIQRYPVSDLTAGTSR